MLPGEAASCGERADQRHFTVIIFFEAKDAGQRLTGDLVGVHAQQVGQVGRERNDAQLFVGGPLVARTARNRPLRRRRGLPRGAAPRGANRPAFERQGNVIAFGSRLDPQLDVVIGRCGKRRTRDRRAQLARKLGDCRDLRQCKRLAKARSRFALQRFEVGIGGNQPTGAVESAEDRPGSTGALATSLPEPVQCRPIRRRSRSQRARRLDLIVGHAVEQVDRRARIGDAEQVANPRQQPGAEIARQVHHTK